MKTTARPETFEDLAAARREWIDSILRPWCLQANRKQLCQAHAEWLDIAGRVDINATLWTWAWERFEALTYPDLPGVNETSEVQVNLKDGTSASGFPDSRQSLLGVLVLVSRDAESGLVVEHGPFSIDDIESVVSL